MAVFQFSALSDGQSLAFNPNADVLNFDQTTVAAADLNVRQVGTNISIEVVSGSQAGKDVTLQNMTPLQLATTNISRPAVPVSELARLSFSAVELSPKRSLLPSAKVMLVVASCSGVMFCIVSSFPA